MEKSFFLIYLSKNLILKIPTIAEVMIPTKTEILIPINKSFTFNIAAPNIIGVDNKKVNFAAASLDTPINLAVKIVVPLLEKPGIIANAWDNTIKKVCLKVICL